MQKDCIKTFFPIFEANTEVLITYDSKRKKDYSPQGENVMPAENTYNYFCLCPLLFNLRVASYWYDGVGLYTY